MRHIHLDTVDSTNTYARKLLASEIGSGEAVLVTASEQTAGRGRTGKSFSSLRDNGIYMTLAVPLRRKPQDAVFLTCAAGTAVHQVLSLATGLPFAIKWVNDIYLSEKKVAGILTEAITDMDTGLMTHALIGIGLNCNADIARLPEELKDIAGTFPYEGDPLLLAEEIAARVSETIAVSFSGEEGYQKVLADYRGAQLLTGREVFWEENGNLRRGIAAGINDRAELLVRTEEGTVSLSSGEVSVRWDSWKG